MGRRSILLRGVTLLPRRGVQLFRRQGRILEHRGSQTHKFDQGFKRYFYDPDGPLALLLSYELKKKNSLKLDYSFFGF